MTNSWCPRRKSQQSRSLREDRGTPRGQRNTERTEEHREDRGTPRGGDVAEKGRAKELSIRFGYEGVTYNFD